MVKCCGRAWSEFKQHFYFIPVTKYYKKIEILIVYWFQYIKIFKSNMSASSANCCANCPLHQQNAPAAVGVPAPPAVVAPVPLVLESVAAYRQRRTEEESQNYILNWQQNHQTNVIEHGARITIAKSVTDYGGNAEALAYGLQAFSVALTAAGYTVTVLPSPVAGGFASILVRMQ